MRSRVLSGIALAALVALALAACASSAQPSVTTSGTGTPTVAVHDVRVNLTGTEITPASVSVTTGTRYRFIVANLGTTQNECMIGPQTLTKVPAQQRQKHALATTRAVAPGMEQAIEYTFPTSATKQQLMLVCYDGNGPGHQTRLTVNR